MYVYMYVCPQVSLAFCRLLRDPMSFGPGGANASSAAQPVATESFMIISAGEPGGPAAQPGKGRLDVRWQVEQSSGRWWDIPQSVAIDRAYKESTTGVTYNYDWGALQEQSL